MASESFATRFHSISGTTVGERRKNLFLLFKDFTNPNELDFSFQPNNPLEEKLKVDVLIHFRRASELLDLLKGENPILVKKVLKVPWLLDETVGKITGEDLACKVFPFISFNAKVKLLNKLAAVLGETQGDEFYQAVEKKYGLYLASKLLGACSAQHVLDCVKYKRVKLTSRQMLAHTKRHPQVTEDLFKVMKDKQVEIRKMYANVFKYLSQYDYALYKKLDYQYNFRVKFGRRKTKKFLRDKKSDVIKHPGSYYEFLHNKQIARSLKNEFALLFQNFFPTKLNYLSSNNRLFSVFRALPKKMHDINLLTSTFEKVYNKSFWSEPSLADVQYWELLPLAQRYEKIKTEPRPSHVTEEEWVCYKKTEESIPFLKKTISLTSDIKKRADLIRLLVKTCHLNDDKKALLHICKYMLTKHRNDNTSVRKAFLSMIYQKFKLEELEAEHWAVIEELIQLFTLNNEYFSKEDFLEGYIRFRLEKNLPVKEQLTEWIKEYDNLALVRDKPEHEKYCLLTFGELIPELFTEETQEDEDREFSSRADHFISALQLWNKCFPKDKISVFSYPYLLRRLTELVRNAKGKWYVVGYIEYIIKTEDDCQEKEDLINLYLSKPEAVDIKIIRWLTYHRPLIVINNLESVSKCALEENYCREDCFFWKWWRNYTHLDNFRKVIDISLEKVKHEMDENSNYACTLKNPIRSLSHLMTVEEFKTFITPYYPVELRAEGKTKGDEAHYAMQQQIGNTLRYVTPPSAVLESILLFCKGDYLKIIQKSLYSVSSAVTEDKLSPFFNELSDRAVSTRKHSMHLALRVLDREHVLNVLRYFTEKEKNASLRKFILKGVFNFFIANPDDGTWEMVKSNIRTVDMEDKEALDVFMQVDKIPAQYIPQYITFTWNLLDILPDPHDKRESHKSSLLQAISPEIVVLLPDDFINHVLGNFFFKTGEDCNTGFNSDVQDLACKYVIYCNSPEERQRRLNACFDVVKNYVKYMWNKPNHRTGCRNYLANFMKVFCSKFLNKRSTNLDVLEKFRDAWNSIFQPHQGIKEYLHLELTVLIYQNMPAPELAQKLAQLCDSLGHRYNFAVVEPFYTKMDFLLMHFMTKSTANWYVLAESILKSATSVYSMALVAVILTRHRSYDDERQAKHEEMIGLLQKNQNTILELYLEDLFRDKNTALDYH